MLCASHDMSSEHVAAPPSLNFSASQKFPGHPPTQPPSLRVFVILTTASRSSNGCVFCHMLFTHRIACVFTQLLLLFHHQFLKARRAERGALLLVRDQLRYREFGAFVRSQLRLAPRSSAGCTKRFHIAASTGNSVACEGLSSFKGGRGRAAQIRLRRRKHPVQLFLFSLKHP